MVGDQHRRPELPEGAQPAQQHASKDRAPGDGEACPEKDASGPVPERGRDILQHRIDRGEGRARRDDQEWRRDESLGQHDADERIRQRAMSERAERARIAEQEQQQDAAGKGRQRQRQLHDEAKQGHGAAGPPGQKIAERNAADRDAERGGGGAQQRDDGRVGEARPVGAAPIRRARPGDARHEGCDEVEREEPAEPG